MKKIFKFPLAALAAAALAAGVYSCDNNTGNVDEGFDETMSSTIEKYVNDVVVATYKSLANESMALNEACADLNETLSQANIDAACAKWKSARVYWELSEAFLFGPAKNYYVDPHIDSWPLDKELLDQTLKNTTLMNNIKEHGCNFPGFASLGDLLLGFHSVEYMLFRDGGARNVAGGTGYGALTDDERAYCAAVAEDLRNHCIYLEACWAGMENVSQEKQDILEEAEMETDVNYGDAMKDAGERGNPYFKTQISAYKQMLMGMTDITDEVGNTKITEPVDTGNVLDVESWYSWNSITDFADNMRGVKNAYYGSTNGSVATMSLSSFVKSKNAALDTKVKAAIDKAIAEIEDMPAPFRNHLTLAETEDAIDACNDLLDLFEGDVLELMN